MDFRRDLAEEMTVRRNHSWEPQEAESLTLHSIWRIKNCNSYVLRTRNCVREFGFLR